MLRFLFWPMEPYIICCFVISQSHLPISPPTHCILYHYVSSISQILQDDAIQNLWTWPSFWLWYSSSWPLSYSLSCWDYNNYFTESFLIAHFLPQNFLYIFFTSLVPKSLSFTMLYILHICFHFLSKFKSLSSPTKKFLVSFITSYIMRSGVFSKLYLRTNTAIIV